MKSECLNDYIASLENSVKEIESAIESLKEIQKDEISLPYTIPLNEDGTQEMDIYDEVKETLAKIIRLDRGSQRCRQTVKDLLLMFSATKLSQVNKSDLPELKRLAEESYLNLKEDYKDE